MSETVKLMLAVVFFYAGVTVSCFGYNVFCKHEDWSILRNAVEAFFNACEVVGCALFVLAVVNIATNLRP